jgi:hypothetical protein
MERNSFVKYCNNFGHYYSEVSDNAEIKYVEGNWARGEEWRLLGYKNPVRTSQETH